MGLISYQGYAPLVDLFFPCYNGPHDSVSGRGGICVRGLQQAIDRFIDNVQEQWETSGKFRATWSTIGSAMTLLMLCGCMLLISTFGAVLIFGGKNPSVNSDVQSQAQNNSQNYPVPAYTPGAGQTNTNAQPVAASNAPTPTPTIPPTYLPLTPTATPPGASSVAFTVQQLPNPWSATLPAQLIGLQSTPAQPNAVVTLTINYRGNCTQALPPVTLDSSGSQPNPIIFTIPDCAQPSNNITITVTGTGFAPSQIQQTYSLTR